MHLRLEPGPDAAPREAADTKRGERERETPQESGRSLESLSASPHQHSPMVRMLRPNPRRTPVSHYQAGQSQHPPFQVEPSSSPSHHRTLPGCRRS